MKKWEELRRESISDHILVTHIIGVFIFFMSLLAFQKTTPDKDPGIFVLMSLAFSLLGIMAVSYIGKKLVAGITLADRYNTGDVFLIILSFAIAVGILYLTGESDSPVKIVLIIPVIIASTSLGKTAGMVTAGAASAILLFFNFTYVLDLSPSIKFQTDIVNSTVMFTLAWLFGGLADTERVARENLTLLANTDDLTGMSNHRHFQEVLRQNLESAGKNNRPLSLIKLDIDYFKFYNKNYGFLQGDEVLKQVGVIINDAVKWPCFAARYGSDEFTIIVPDANSEGLMKAEEIRKKIEAYPFAGAEVLPNRKITVSLGVAGFPEQGNTPEAILRMADEAMYKAKYTRNRAQLYSSVIDDLRHNVNETERDFFNSIKTLLMIINAKDRYTYGHSERVVYYSLRLAEKLNLPDQELMLLRYSSVLHDIGKLEIGSDILNKSEFIKSTDLEILQKHPVWGSDIVRPISSLKEVIPAILYHHENYDGTGYPEGLSKEDIPMHARILRITDSFDAMTTDRPYKNAISFSEACVELKKCSGTLYDPGLAAIFIELINEMNKIEMPSVF